jgi:GNAT superfamily N-acetyltransferase
MTLIREFDSAIDFYAVRNCVVELQDYERRIDSRMPSGDDIADACIQDMLDRCEESSGTILVAVADNVVCGYACILAKVNSDAIYDGNIEYGLIVDLVVLDGFRSKGIGRKLIDAAELYARSKGVRWLRLCVMSENSKARRLYEACGFSELYIDLEKALR